MEDTLSRSAYLVLGSAGEKARHRENLCVRKSLESLAKNILEDAVEETIIPVAMLFPETAVTDPTIDNETKGAETFATNEITA